MGGLQYEEEALNMLKGGDVLNDSTFEFDIILASYDLNKKNDPVQRGVSLFPAKENYYGVDFVFLFLSQFYILVKVDESPMPKIWTEYVVGSSDMLRIINGGAELSQMIQDIADSEIRQYLL